LNVNRFGPDFLACARADAVTLAAPQIIGTNCTSGGLTIPACVVAHVKYQRARESANAASTPGNFQTHTPGFADNDSRRADRSRRPFETAA
jgi:hypothetical protein